MLYVPANSEIVSQIGEEISNSTRTRTLQTIAFFDLVGSTGAKLKYGHERGLEDSSKATLLFKKVVEHHDGYVVKELGDGVLTRFDDPIDAALASLDILTLAPDLGISVKGGITLGLVDLIELDTGGIDVIGTTVDRCARIESFCLASQILVDRPYLDAVQSFLASYSNIEISSHKVRHLKGIGDTELIEICSSDVGLKKYLYTDFRVHEEGRIPLQDKVNFVKDATQEVIEIGTGLRTFSQFFSGQRPAEFQKYIENLVVKGVDVTLLALDPDWNGTDFYLDTRDEQEYKNDIVRSLADLKNEQRRLLKLGVRGRFEIRVYQTIPFAHILCVDPKDEVFGRMFVSNYLPGLTRSEAPVLELSALSNPELFQKYKKVIIEVINKKSKVLN